MGYFEGITNAYFKIGKDSRRLFYPWGALGAGYVIEAKDEARLRGAIKGYIIAAIVLTAAGYVLWHETGVLVAGGVLIVGYAVATRFMVHGLEAASERLGLREAYAAEAHGFGKGWLWTSLVIMTVMFALSVAMFVAAPDLRLQAAGSMALFAALAAFSGWMIMLRSRAGQSQSKFHSG